MSKGFSTIEVVFSIFLVAVTLVVYAASLNLSPLIRTERNQNTAYHVAVKQLEMLRNTDYSSLPASGAVVDPDLAMLPAGQVDLSFVQEAPGLMRANVTVSWTESGTLRSVRLDTYIYENGISKL